MALSPADRDCVGEKEQGEIVVVVTDVVVDVEELLVVVDVAKVVVVAPVVEVLVVIVVVVDVGWVDVVVVVPEV